MKKSIVFVIALIVIFSAFTFTETDEPSEWAVESIEELKSYNEFRDKAFKNYQGNITRGEFIYIAVRLYELFDGEEIIPNPSISFIDTDDVYALKGSTIGITSGVGSNKFAPDDSLTREQLATFMIRILKLGNVEMNVATDYEFVDEDIFSSWSKESIYIAKANGIIGGVGNNTFNPKGKATSEMALVIANRIISNNQGKAWISLSNDTAHSINVVASDNNVSKSVDEANAVDESAFNASEIEMLSNAVVSLVVTDNNSSVSTGSGFFIEENQLVTNFHVIDGLASIKVFDNNQALITESVSIVSFSEELDLAILELDYTSDSTLKKGDSRKLEKGDKIFTISSQYGLSNTFAEGIVDASEEDSIQISPRIIQDSLGGVLLNEYGEAVGLISSGTLDNKKFGFAIPIDKLEKLNEVNLTMSEFSSRNNNFLDFDNGDEYYGDIVDGKPHGEGIYLFLNGDTYIGNFNSGLFDGSGLYTWVGGSTYYGGWLEGKMHGYGKYTYADETIIKGYWEYGEFTSLLNENDTSSNSEYITEEHSISFDVDTVQLRVGQNYRIPYTVVPRTYNGFDISIKSSNWNTVLTWTDSNIQAIRAGTAVIKIETADGAIDYCDVIVLP